MAALLPTHQIALEKYAEELGVPAQQLTGTTLSASGGIAEAQAASRENR